MEVLGWIFLIVIALAVLGALVVTLANADSIKRYLRIKRM